MTQLERQKCFLPHLNHCKKYTQHLNPFKKHIVYHIWITTKKMYHIWRSKKYKNIVYHTSVTEPILCLVAGDVLSGLYSVNANNTNVTDSTENYYITYISRCKFTSNFRLIWMCIWYLSRCKFTSNFRLVSMCICTEEFEFLDLVDFWDTVFSAETSIGDTPDMQSIAIPI